VVIDLVTLHEDRTCLEFFRDLVEIEFSHQFPTAICFWHENEWGNEREFLHGEFQFDCLSRAHYFSGPLIVSVSKRWIK
ncbi:hypothetical protein LissoIVSPER_00040, partial [Lissonota sp. PSUC_FEM 10030012]|nr:hypothetical protein [Lissonota sp. PSUC_FEM 10030012]